jgi:hypothetical protein
MALIGNCASLAETGSTTAPAAPPPEELDLASILRRLGQTYAGMAGYYDRGVSTVYSSRHPELNRTQTFTTRFERSTYFSWVSDLGDKTDYRITFDGVRVVEQWYGRRRERADLGDAIASATGISDSAAFWIPTLLMPEMIESAGLLHTFSRASSATRLADEEVGGQHCFVLRAQSRLTDVRVWISTRDFLIRRITHQNAGRDEVITTSYTPRTDISLAP